MSVPASVTASRPEDGRTAGSPADMRSVSGNAAIHLGWLPKAAVAVAVLAMLISLLMWQRLDRIQQELARREMAVNEQSNRSKELLEHTDELIQALQARLSVAEVKLSEVSLQRTQLEELMLSVSRSRDDTLVLDIESSLRFAIQHAGLTGSPQPLVSALLAADERIAKAAQPRLNPVQRAIARDIERIKASAVADLPALASQLDELGRIADGLPLLNAAPETKVTSRPARARSKEASVRAANGVNAAETQGDAGGFWRQVQLKWLQFWDTLWNSAVQSTRDLVRVSQIDAPEAALLAPDQSVFLRENLKLKLLNARLNLLLRQLSAARADMQAARTSMQKYFDTEELSTQQAIQTLADALQATRVVEMPRPDDTLTALAAAAQGR